MEDAMSERAGESPEQFDPAEHTVDEVNAYLAEHPEDRERVIALEDGEGGKARATVQRDWTPDEGAPEPPQPVVGQDVTGGTTKARTFTEAAEQVTEQHAQGFLGASPGRDKTGRSDKGLSQRNPAVMGRTDG